MGSVLVKHSLVPLGSAVAAAVLLTAGLSGTARAADVWASDAMAVGSAEALAIVGFWTADGAAAFRRAMPFQPGKDSPTLTSGGDYTPDGEPGSVSPAHEAGHVPNPDPPSGVLLPMTIGKIFFVDHEGKERWCSATSIQSAHRNLVATAGHCVYNPTANGQVMGKWVFVPSYYEGKAPYGVYPGLRSWTHRDFDALKDHDRDFAFVNVHNGLSLTSIRQVTQPEYDAFTGAKWTRDGLFYVAESQDRGRLGDNVGGQGLAWNQRITLSTPPVYAFGYPAGLQPDGTRPYTGTTPKWAYGRPTRTPFTSAMPPIEEHMGLKAAFTTGADGGPLLSLYTDRLGYVTGVISLFADVDRNYRYDHITSPYFDGETAAVYWQAGTIPSGPVISP
jgi:hypothetical protein